MRFLEMGAAFAVIGFVVANALLSAAAALLWRLVQRSRLRADSLFLLRMLPALGSAAFVTGVVLPAYWLFEPRNTSESAGPAIGAVALAATVLLVMGMRRVLNSWREARRLERVWRIGAVRAAEPSLPVRAYRVPARMPLAALVGVIRPRLFVSGQFLDALLPEERQAVMDHEAAHLHALDNLKRAAVKLAPDWLSFFPAGRQIEAAWMSAAEEEADDRAAGPDRSRALELAGALIKASRLAPTPCTAVINFCEDSTIVRRVARLLDDRPAGRRPESRRASRLLLALALVTAAGLLAEPGLRAVYTLSEGTVRILHAAW